MLVLSRKLNESIVIDGHIIVKITGIDHDTVKLGIQAPTALQVHRQEIHEAIQSGQPRPPAPTISPLLKRQLTAATRTAMEC